MSDLLPCPFCGDVGPSIREDDGKFCIVCTSIDCYCAVGEGYDGCAMPNHAFYEAEAAIAAWNTRPAITHDNIEDPSPPVSHRVGDEG